MTSGAATKQFTPDALAWYSLTLVVPVAILAVPAFVRRNILFMVAFLAILGLLVFLGIGYHLLYNQVVAATVTRTAPNLGTAVDLVRVSAWCGLAAALAIWAVFAKEVYQITGLIKRQSE